MSTPHDALFKAIYSNPEHARGALQAALPPSITSMLAWPTLASCRGSFVDPKLDQHHTDLLFSLKWHAGGEALVYVLFEHQSTNDPHMPFRLMRYLVRIWEHWLDQHTDAIELPVILPIVLAHDRKGWTAARSLRATIAVPDAMRAALEPYLPELRYTVDDLTTLSDAELRDRMMSALATAGAVCLKYARYSIDLPQLLMDWLEIFQQVKNGPNGRDAFEQLLRYLTQVNDMFDGNALFDALEAQIAHIKDRPLTPGERWILKHRQLGAQEALSRTMLTQARQRFGDVVANDEQRILGASLAELEAWLERLIAAPSLSAVLAG